MSKRTERFCDLWSQGEPCTNRASRQCPVCGRDYCGAHAGKNVSLYLEFYFTKKASVMLEMCQECQEKFRKNELFKLSPELMRQFEGLRDDAAKPGDHVVFWQISTGLIPQIGTVRHSEIKYGSTYADITPDDEPAKHVYLFHRAVWGFEKCIKKS